jgi:hypothetical protein
MGNLSLATSPLTDSDTSTGPDDPLAGTTPPLASADERGDLLGGRRG